MQVASGDLVLLRGGPAAAPLLTAIYKLAVLRGGHAHTHIVLPGLEEFFMRQASLEQVRFISPIEHLVTDKYQKFISIMSEDNTHSMAGAPPERQVERARAWEPLMRREMEREAAGELKWVVSLFPTQAYAQDADMSLEEYEDFVYGACLPEPADPIGYWERFARYQEAWVKWLDGRRHVHILGRDTDLTFSVEGRKFINCDGKNNFPDGEIYTGPVEDSVNGTVRFTFPAIEAGREVDNVWLRFEAGRVVEAKADKGEAFLHKMLDTDAGARRLGEFAIGTNAGIQRFTKNVLFDEKIGGTFHLALGRSYPDSRGQNESAIHWDMVCDLRPGGEIRVDDVLIHKDGKFTFDPSV